MKEPKIWIGFVLASLMAVMQSALFPNFVLLPYSPFIALVCMFAPYQKALWLAALAGISSDLLSSDLFGLYALTATLSCALVYRYRWSLFKEEPLQLCFYTALISFIQTPFMLMILFLFDRRAPIAGKSILLDIVSMPIVDALYAFFWFVGPILLWEWGFRQWKLWRLNKNESP
jgi:rod shape-determining protein MreD